MWRHSIPPGRWLVAGALSAAATLAVVSPAGLLSSAGAGAAAATMSVTAVAPAELGGPAVGSWGGGQLDVFYRSSANGQLVDQRYLPGPLASWQAGQSLGGTLTSQPAVASWATGRYDVVGRGTDNAVWHKWYSGGTWSGWQSLGGVASSAPAEATWGPGRLDLFVRGTDNALWTRYYTAAAGWSAWSSLGGILTSAPAAVSWGTGRIDVFVRGADNAVWHKWYSGGTWSGWQSLGGIITSAPGVASSGTGNLDLFGRGADNALWTRNWRASTGRWSGWAGLGGVLTSSPSATSPAAGTVAVFVTGTDGRFYYRQSSATGAWAGWVAIDTAVTFRGLGAWIDLYDYSLAPATVVSDLRAHHVRTLYLETARYDSAADILYPAAVGAWLDAAHAAGIRVVGWYVPDYKDLSRDVRRTLAVASYVSPDGQRFDAVGIDIEYPLTVPDANAWNQAVATQLAQVRAGTTRPLVAIVLPPMFMKVFPDRWATFPWSAIAADASAVAPMSYWTSYTANRLCTGGNQQYCAYEYTRQNVLLARQYTGLPVHIIGGVGGQATLSQVSDFVRAARETAAAGGSFYDYQTTDPAFWPYLEQLNP